MYRCQGREVIPVSEMMLRHGLSNQDRKEINDSRDPCIVQWYCSGIDGGQ